MAKTSQVVHVSRETYQINTKKVKEKSIAAAKGITKQNEKLVKQWRREA